jgi:hypothetical protein
MGMLIMFPGLIMKKHSIISQIVILGLLAVVGYIIYIEVQFIRDLINVVEYARAQVFIQ